METPQVKAQPREAMGKGVKKLRREGVLPGVVYGTSIAGVEPIALNARDFAKVYAQTGLGGTVQLQVEGGATRTARIFQVQHDNLHRNLIHVDFYVS